MNKPVNNHHIVVFDSGVGGLSIVEHLRRTLPLTTITYLADNALFPYGLLDEKQLIARVVQVTGKLCRQQQTDLIIIGCNSASTVVLPHLRNSLSVPVVGVVPAIKPAAQLSRNKVIGLLATPGTINRDYTNGLIGDFARDCDIIRVGSSQLVELIELKLRGHAPAKAAIVDILKPFREHSGYNNLDTVILACTHFPLALAELSAAAPGVTHWIDSGSAIARQTAHLLQSVTPSQANGKNVALFTNISSVNVALKNYLRKLGFSTVEPWYT